MSTDKDPYSVFDWDFSDALNVESARHCALRDKPTETDQLMSLISVDSIVHFALWSQLPDRHPIRELWLETNTDLQAAIYLAYGGYFRQALTAVRSWFEIVLQGIYFSNHYGQPNGRYEQWRLGQRNAPLNMDDIAQSLASRSSSDGSRVAKQVIADRLTPIYSFLSLHAHGQGLDIFDLQDGRDNVPRYLPRSFDLWFEKLFETVDAAYFLYAAYFRQEITAYLRSSQPEMEMAISLCAELETRLPSYVAIIRV